MCCSCVSEVGPMSGHLHHHHWSTNPFFLFLWHFQTAAQLNNIGETISCKFRKQSPPTVWSCQVIFRPPASSHWHGQRWNPCTAASSISEVSPIHPADCQLNVFLFVCFLLFLIGLAVVLDTISIFASKQEKKLFLVVFPLLPTGFCKSYIRAASRGADTFLMLPLAPVLIDFENGKKKCCAFYWQPLHLFFSRRLCDTNL